MSQHQPTEEMIGLNKSFKEIRDILVDDPMAIRRIEKQPLLYCLIAVSIDGMAIQHINKLNFHWETWNQICERAVKQNGMAIQFIDDRNWYIWHMAARSNGLCIQFADNPSDSLCIEAITNNVEAFKYIKNPSEKVKNFYIQKTS